MLGDVTREDLDGDPAFAFWVRFRVQGWPTRPHEEWPLGVCETVTLCDAAYFGTGKAVEDTEKITGTDEPGV
jgi:hypothetical protein